MVQRLDQSLEAQALGKDFTASTTINLWVEHKSDGAMKLFAGDDMRPLRLNKGLNLFYFYI